MAIGFPNYFNGSQPNGGFGQDFSFIGTPTVEETFSGRPADLWRSARISQLGGQAALPQFQKSAMAGFQPAYGRYLLSGYSQPFAQYLKGTSTGGGIQDYASQARLQPQWNALVGASRSLNPGMGVTSLTPAQIQYRGLLEGPDARANAIAMSMAGMGGVGGGGRFGGGWSQGIGGQARQRALGNLYDLYSDRAAAKGLPAGGFINWLNSGLG
jgi:hypothetical protein